MTTSIDALLQMQKAVEKYEKKYRKSATELEEIKQKHMTDTGAMTKLKIQRTNKENTLCSCMKRLKKLKYEVNKKNKNQFKMKSLLNSSLDQYFLQGDIFRTYQYLYSIVNELFDNFCNIEKKGKPDPFVLLMQYFLQEIKDSVFERVVSCVKEKLKNTSKTVSQVGARLNYFNIVTTEFISEITGKVYKFYMDKIGSCYTLQNTEYFSNLIEFNNETYGLISTICPMISKIITWQAVNDPYMPIDWESITKNFQIPALLQKRGVKSELLDPPTVLVASRKFKCES